MVLAGQDACGFRFGAQLEGDSPLLQVHDLLLYCEDGLPVLAVCHRQSPVIDLRILFYSMFALNPEGPFANS